MSEEPLVSVIIATRNRREMLDRCLEALSRQTYEQFEVIVVDDGSSDGTTDSVVAFATAHPDGRWRWLRNDRGAGANRSRNRGLRESRGGYIAFLDDDCIAEPEWLERLMAGFVSENVAAVTGAVVEPEPTNVYERMLKGTSRVHGGVHASRLVAGNLCVRRERLCEFMLEEDTPGSGNAALAGRGDEDGLFLRLRAAGYEQRVVHDAVVLHNHHHARASFYRLAYKSGAAAARLGYKYHLAPRVELMPLLFAYLSLPLIWIGPFGWLCPAAAASLFLAAVTYNELTRKRKTAFETLVIFPVLLGYYHVRLVGYVHQYLRLWLGADKLDRVRLGSSPQ